MFARLMTHPSNCYTQRLGSGPNSPHDPHLQGCWKGPAFPTPLALSLPSHVQCDLVEDTPTSLARRRTNLLHLALSLHLQPRFLPMTHDLTQMGGSGAGEEPRKQPLLLGLETEVQGASKSLEQQSGMMRRNPGFSRLFSSSEHLFACGVEAMLRLRSQQGAKGAIGTLISTIILHFSSSRYKAMI